MSGELTYEDGYTNGRDRGHIEGYEDGIQRGRFEMKNEIMEALEKIAKVEKVKA